MADTLFNAPERRSFLVPVVLALAALAVAIGLAVHFFPATSVDIQHLHTDAVPTETKFKGSTIIGQEHVEQNVFVASRVRIVNQTRAPIYLDDFHLTITDPDGSARTVQGAQQRELPDLATNFPALAPHLDGPLLRNQTIEPGSSAEGVLVFMLAGFTQTDWNARKTAVIKVDLYHLPAVYATIGK